MQFSSSLWKAPPLTAPVQILSEYFLEVQTTFRLFRRSNSYKTNFMTEMPFSESKPTLWIFDKDEPLMESITRTAKKCGVSGASLTGLGALKAASLGFYHLHKKEYARKQFDDEFELVSLTGNITLKDGEPYVHAHIVLGDTEFRCWGGHLFEALVAVTAEITVVPFDFVPARKLHTDIGLALICELGR
jgi:uncharacterized protein